MINSYEVRNLRETDVEDIYKLCLGNELYYKYCPPAVTEESILADINALPPNKSKEDKHYIGFYDKDNRRQNIFGKRMDLLKQEK